MKEEYSIMPEDLLWKTKRFSGSHRHEVFGGPNRRRSIKDGLVIFLTPEMHNMSNAGIHFNKQFMEYAHKIGQLAWMEYYHKTKEDFIKEYGKSYI